MEEAPAEGGGVKLEVVDRLDRLVALLVLRDELPLPVAPPYGVQPESPSINDVNNSLGSCRDVLNDALQVG